MTRGAETNLRLSSTPSTRTPHAGPFPDLGEILIDQGTSDQFLAEQLLPEHLKEACAAKGQPPSGSTVAAGVKMANTISVFVAAEACLTRRRVPPATLVEESSVAILSGLWRFVASVSVLVSALVSRLRWRVFYCFAFLGSMR